MICDSFSLVFLYVDDRDQKPERRRPREIQQLYSILFRRSSSFKFSRDNLRVNGWWCARGYMIFIIDMVLFVDTFEIRYKFSTDPTFYILRTRFLLETLLFFFHCAFLFSLGSGRDRVSKFPTSSLKHPFAHRFFHGKREVRQQSMLSLFFLFFLLSYS